MRLPPSSPSRRTRHRHQRDGRAGRLFAGRLEQPREHPGHRREDRVVDRAAGRLGGDLDLGQRRPRHREAAVRADPAVEERHRRLRPVARELGEERRSRCAGRRSRAAGSVAASARSAPSASAAGRGPSARRELGEMAAAVVTAAPPRVPSGAGQVHRLGVGSSRTVPTSIAATPSTSAWCILARARRVPPARPSTTVISHSGRERSRRREISCPTPPSSSGPPVAGSAARRTCQRASKLVVVDPHRVRHRPAPADCRRWR